MPWKRGRKKHKTVHERPAPLTYYTVPHDDWGHQAVIFVCFCWRMCTFIEPGDSRRKAPRTRKFECHYCKLECECLFMAPHPKIQPGATDGKENAPKKAGVETDEDGIGPSLRTGALFD